MRGAKFCRKNIRAIGMALAFTWVGLIGWQASVHAPSMPLDMNAADAETKSAFDAAVAKHNLRAGALALIPPALAFSLWSLLFGKKRDAPGTISGPARILLMRHAEKTGDPEDLQLSAAGKARAEKLAAYIPATFGKPDFIFAAARSKRSLRSIETMQPLVAATGVPFNSSIADNDYKDLVDRLRGDPVYDGKFVIICWHHSDLSKIARALGAAEGTFPDPWDEAVFNLILDISFQAGKVPVIKQIVEPF